MEWKDNAEVVYVLSSFLAFRCTFIFISQSPQIGQRIAENKAQLSELSAVNSTYVVESSSARKHGKRFMAIFLIKLANVVSQGLKGSPVRAAKDAKIIGLREG
jgi:hypothetical protein